MRLAMKHGCSLVPVFSFNECNTYKQVSDDFPGVGWLKRKWQSVLGISFPLVTNIFPRRTSVTTVVGRPLHVQQVADPSAEQVAAVFGLVLTDPRPTHVKLGRWLLSRSNRRCNKACTRNVRYSAAQRSLTLLFCRWVRLGLGFSPKPETEPALLHSQQ